MVIRSDRSGKSAARPVIATGVVPRSACCYADFGGPASKNPVPAHQARRSKPAAAWAPAFLLYDATVASYLQILATVDGFLDDLALVRAPTSLAQ
jgi:hypothetical protein